MPTFRLDKDPWIPVVDRTGRQSLVDLTTVFERATDVASVSGTPPEAAAITRFLLAIVHLVETPTSLEGWRILWANRVDLMSRCASYVNGQGHVWDLYHHSSPFGQDPELRGTLNPAHILIYEAARKNNAVHADHRIVETAAPVEPASLVRGILAANAFAGSSGGGYTSGPLCMRSVAMLIGDSLASSLLLNLLVQKQSPAAYDWASYGAKSSGRQPDLARRYLWRSRRVRLLQIQESDPRQAFLAPGDEMSPDDKEADPMVPFRLDSKGKSYVALRLESGHALWRSAHVLLNWSPDARPLGAIDQLSRLARRELLDQDCSVSLRVCSLSGDAQGPKTELWRDESLPFGLSLLGDNNRLAKLKASVSAAEVEASKARKRIFGFAFVYLQNGAEAKPDKADAGRLADELAPDLSDFWAELAPGGERIACDDFDEDDWANQVKLAADRAFRKAVDRLPPNARRFRAEFAHRKKEAEAA